MKDTLTRLWERVVLIVTWVYDRLLVILGAAPTYLMAVSAVLIVLRDDIVELLPTAWQGAAAEFLVTVIAALGTAILIIRRVTPVLREHRGLLPVSDQTPQSAVYEFVGASTTTSGSNAAEAPPASTTGSAVPGPGERYHPERPWEIIPDE